MQPAYSYQTISLPDDDSERAIDSVTDEFLTAVLNKEEFNSWTFPEVLGELSTDNNAMVLQDEFIRQSAFGVVMPETREAYMTALQNVVREIVIKRNYHKSEQQ